MYQINYKMDIRHIPARLEIQFWCAAIMMMSESKFIRSSIQYIYDFFTDHDHVKLIKQSLVWSGTGLLMGFILGLVIR